MFFVNKYKCTLCKSVIFKKHRVQFCTQYDDFASGYVPNIVEKGKYNKWEKNLNYKPSVNSSNPFTMIMPPPNITGTLHLGHALTISIQDVLMRWHRMLGHSTCWVPGFDHAGIATQVVVEKQLWSSRKQTRHDLGRDAFKDEVWKWGESKSEIIRNQIREMGALPNWEKEYFTMDQRMSRAVNKAFIRLFESGQIYRSDLLVNWSCVLRSAISDVEVDHVEVAPRTRISVPGYEQTVEFGVLTKFAYKLCEQEGFGEIIVSTTRPETILGDVAIAVHPADVRYQNFHGKKVIHPFHQKPIPIIVDEFVDPSFGTGAVKITPAHDPTDFVIGRKYNLPTVQVINERGEIVDSFSRDVDDLVGMKRFLAREVVVQRLARMGLLRGVEDHPMTIPLCSRSGDVIEHLIKPQWFVNCTKMAADAVQDVREGRLTIEPATFEKTWFNWLENIRDWCISRQLWWGHRIPAYRCKLVDQSEESAIWVSAEDDVEARKKAAAKLGVLPDVVVVTQDEDVLDTWFSSGLLPFAVFGWPDKTREISQYYPTSILETGHDILFFWVARMVMLSRTLTGELPFKKILLHGIICDAHGRKMSKSLGNVVAPEQVIRGQTLKEMENTVRASHSAGLLSDIELDKAIVGQKKMFPNGIPQCGADALRFTLLSHNIQNHFINFDVNECYTNKLFCNKIWQALKYTRLSADKLDSNLLQSTTDNSTIMDKWILSRLSYMISKANESLHGKEFHNATSALKDFLYGDFCDVYLEATKPNLKSGTTPEAFSHVKTLVQCLEISLRALTPFMPHLCEELYKHLPRGIGVDLVDDIHKATYPQESNWRDENLEKDIQIALDAVTVLRRLRKLGNVTSKQQPKAYILTTSSIFSSFSSIIQTLSGIHSLQITPSFNPQSLKTISDTVDNHATVYLVLPQNTVQSSKSKTSGAAPRDETGYLKKKIGKLMTDIEKMEKMILSEGYRKKAAPEIQKGHNKKLVALKEELQKLQQLQR